MAMAAVGTPRAMALAGALLLIIVSVNGQGNVSDTTTTVFNESTTPPIHAEDPEDIDFSPQTNSGHMELLTRIHNSPQETPQLSPLIILPGSECHLSPTDLKVQADVEQLLAEDVKLITYNFLKVGNWTPRYPLATWGWARVSNDHGQTLLSMEYTYGLMSLMTLSIGHESLDIELVDEPHGCAKELSPSERNRRLMDICLRDFSNASDINIGLPERICHEVVVNTTGVAKFGNR